MKTRIAFLTLLICTTGFVTSTANAANQPELGRRSTQLLTVDGLQFKDLNQNGRLDPYEDWRLPIDQRVENLVTQLTLEEKAGLMMHGTAPADGLLGQSARGYDLLKAKEFIIEQRVNSFITRLALAPALFAEQNNALQTIAESSRLGIPITISSDPRNYAESIVGAGNAAAGFSIWPEPLGMAASGDAGIARQFGDMARQEYRAVGIHMALSPQADLFTEPRWTRGNGTFGDDPDLAGAMVRAYVEGFQHGDKGVTTDGVVTIVKHWVGYGASRDGFDGHNYYGRFSKLDEATLKLHIKPFEGAFAAKVGGVMPTYNILEGAQVNGKQIEQIGAGFSHELLTDLLRGKYAYDGLILSDWSISQDCNTACQTGNPPQLPKDIGMSWGVEKLSRVERFAKGINAGLDQFGGVSDSQAVLDAVKAGLIAESRLDQSARHILKIKFQLGLFENPYVDPADASAIVNARAFQLAAENAQHRSVVLLENHHSILPLKSKTKVYLDGIDRMTAEQYGLVVVDRPELAKVAIIKVAAPFEKLHPNHFFGSRQHEGDLAFKEGEAGYDKIAALSKRLPTIVLVYLDRPAILTEIKDKVAAIIGDFGANTTTLMAIVTGQVHPTGKLPFELPSSMSAVEAQSPALPHDSAQPLYPFGYGLKY